MHCNNGEGISSSHQQNTQNSSEIDNVSQQQQQQQERDLQSKSMASYFDSIIVLPIDEIQIEIKKSAQFMNQNEYAYPNK